MVLAGWMIGVLVFFVYTLLLMVFGLLVGLWRYKYNRVNNLDICILDMTKHGYRGRFEVGRKDFCEGKGFHFVTAFKIGLPRSLKDDLGYHLSDDDMVESANGRGRKLLIVAKKDGLVASLRHAAVDLSLSDSERASLDMAVEKLGVSSVSVGEIPTSLSLIPVKSEQTRFNLDAAEMESDLLGDSQKKKLTKLLFAAAIGVFTLSLVLSFVILIIMINQGPQFAEKVIDMQVKSNSAVVVTPSNAPVGAGVPESVVKPPLGVPGLPLPG